MKIKLTDHERKGKMPHFK